jgi:hypothetical protein
LSRKPKAVIRHGIQSPEHDKDSGLLNGEGYRQQVKEKTWLIEDGLNFVIEGVGNMFKQGKD